ncbi:multiheme c-type cytochrome [Anaerolineales bacterium HSG6]|nr:multiheme c-type cytochrome [Anaerolineales bacterium HSG6]
MKKFILLTTLILVIALTTACTGEPGQQGPIGAAGPPGQTGPAGADGLPGVSGTDGRDGEDGVSYTPPNYVGAEACEECHEDIYKSFMKTGHPYKLNKVVDGQRPKYPYSEINKPPEGYTWDDISYVIGGYGWKARFIDKEGYIITGADEDAKTQYNLYNKELDMGDNWVGYHAGEENVPYDCGSCHTTGYDDEEGTHQDGLPGIVGTWVEPGVQCEECHGPGENHVNNPKLVSVKVDRDAEACGKCHVRGDITEIDASGGFIKHHEQYEELFESKKRVMDCIDCHDPHQTVKYAKGLGIKTACENCHFENVDLQKITDRKHAECVDCHMPRVTKSALGDPERFSGDLRTHLMAINPRSLTQFDEEGAVSKPYLSLDFACKSCHYEGGSATVESDEVMMEFAIGHHDRDLVGSYNEGNQEEQSEEKSPSNNK